MIQNGLTRLAERKRMERKREITPLMLLEEKIREATGKSLSTVKNWTKGFTEPTDEDKVRIAKKLGMNIKDLF